MIKCANADCGHENVPGTQFCEGCGEELPQQGTAPASVMNAASGDQAMVKCPACDNLNPAENSVCEVCGTELKPPVAPAVSVAPPASTVPPLGVTPAATLPAVPPPGAAVSSPDAGPAPTPAAGAALAPADLATVDTIPMGAAAPTPPDTGAAPTLPDTGAMATLPAGDLQPGRVKLVVEQGMTVGAQFVLGDEEILVGREDDEEGIYPDIDLSDQDAGYVHRRHARLKFENGNLLITHLGGSNKTRINNRPLPDNDPQPAALGDKIAFGKVVLRLLPV